jgi:hypothetical protein
MEVAEMKTRKAPKEDWHIDPDNTALIAYSDRHATGICR